jgi:hypothetical protein
MSLSRESWRPDIRYPDLYRAQALLAQTFPIVSDPLTNFALSHTAMLHVTAARRIRGYRGSDSSHDLATLILGSTCEASALSVTEFLARQALEEPSNNIADLCATVPWAGRPPFVYCCRP